METVFGNDSNFYRGSDASGVMDTPILQQKKAEMTTNELINKKSEMEPIVDTAIDISTFLKNIIVVNGQTLIDLFRKSPETPILEHLRQVMGHRNRQLYFGILLIVLGILLY